MIGEWYYSRRFLFIPVLLIIGTVSFFQLGYDIDNGNLLTGFIIVLILVYALRKYFYLKEILLAITIGYLGFINIHLHSYLLDKPPLLKNLYDIPITATVEKIEESISKKRILFQQVQIKNYPFINKVRLVAGKNTNHLTAGDRVMLRATIMKLPDPNYPDGYNFSRYAYFNKIDAIGYITKQPKIIEHNQGLSESINNIRNRIIDKLFSILPNEQASIATALIVGYKRLIPTDVYDNLKKAGLAHILAISGMHIVLVTSLVFFMVKLLLSLYRPLGYKIDIYRLSIVIALIFGLLYMLLSGLSISAQRAYIMVFLYWFAVLINRIATPIHCIAVTTILVVILSPYSVLTPSFQMSFMAALFLASFPKGVVTTRYRNLGMRILIYFLSIAILTILASIATLLFTIHYFGSYSIYGLISNLLVLPILGIFIMPLAIIAMVTNSSSLLVIMGYFIEQILRITEFIAQLPSPTNNLHVIDDTMLCVLSFTMILSCLLDGIKKFILLAIIILSSTIYLYFYPPLIPEIIIKDRDTFAVRNKYNKLEFVNLSRVNKFDRGTWSKYYTGYETDNKQLLCNKYYCDYTYNKVQVRFIKKQDRYQRKCSNVQVIVLLYKTSQYTHCAQQNSIIITWRDLRNKGVHIIDINDSISVDNVSDNIGKYPWNLLYRRWN